jgi:hypothetical protein
MGVKEPMAWVVYKMSLFASAAARNAICTQSEWGVMEAARPGQHTLIRGQIGSEGEAERLARDLQTPPEPPKPAKLSYSAIRLAARAERSGASPAAAQ